MKLREGPEPWPCISRRRGRRETVEGTHLLVAAGRQPDLESLDLDAGGIAWTPEGVTVDGRLRASDKRVLAVGDVAGGLRFTHVAGYHAGIAIRNALFRLPAEGGHDCRALGDLYRPRARPCRHDRGGWRRTPSGRQGARAAPRFRRKTTAPGRNATPEGFVKAMVGPRGRVLGATIVGPHAGELIQPWVLAGVAKASHRGAGGHDRALSDARRGVETRRRQLLHRYAVRPPDPPPGPLPDALRLRERRAASDEQVADHGVEPLPPGRPSPGGGPCAR